MTDITNKSKAYFFDLLKNKDVDENLIESYLNSPNFNEFIQKILPELNLSYSNFKNSRNLSNAEVVIDEESTIQELEIKPDLIMHETSALIIKDTHTKESTEAEKLEKSLSEKMLFFSLFKL